MTRFWSELGQDVRYGCRTMAANKAFSALAGLSLALGIGANTAIYSFMDSILLRSLPVEHPERLVILSFWTKENEVHGMNSARRQLPAGQDGLWRQRIFISGIRYVPEQQPHLLRCLWIPERRRSCILRPEIGQKSPGPNMSPAIIFEHSEFLPLRDASLCAMTTAPAPPRSPSSAMLSASGGSEAPRMPLASRC